MFHDETTGLRVHDNVHPVTWHGDAKHGLTVRHEEQRETMWCGLHAVNNVAQACLVSRHDAFIVTQDLMTETKDSYIAAGVAHAYKTGGDPLAAMKKAKQAAAITANPTDHLSQRGDLSVEVIQALITAKLGGTAQLLPKKVFNQGFARWVAFADEHVLDDHRIAGFIVQTGYHWLAVYKKGNHWVYADSLHNKPRIGWPPAKRAPPVEAVLLVQFPKN